MALDSTVCFTRALHTHVIAYTRLTPLAATWLVERTGNDIAPAFLIMAAAAVTFMTLLGFRETYRATFVSAATIPAGVRA